MDVFEQLHSCGMVILNLESNDMSGELSSRWGRFTNLTALDLANSWMSGTVPPELSYLKRLKRLELGANFLHGTIGPWLGSLPELEVLDLGANAGVNDPDDPEGRTGFIGPVPPSLSKLTRLMELHLQLNALTGTIPPGICGPRSPLRMLNLRGNQLTGPATPVTRCDQLASLDLGMNSLSGALPASKDWTYLVSLQLGHNEFSGQIPDDMYWIPLVGYLDIAGNRLVGQLDDRISLLINLNELDVSGNQLSGEIGRGIFYLPQLARLNLANNNFSGTINPSIGLGFNLQELILANNSGLVGRLPDEAAGLSYLRRVGLLGTNMSCEPAEITEAALRADAAGKEAPAAQPCAQGALLPCFLEFESYDVPRSDSSHMRCRPIRRKAVDDAVGSCPPAAMAGTPDPSIEVLAAQWDLPPPYYQYQGCHCLDGYKAVWSREGTHLDCVEDRLASLPPWTWVLVALGAALMLLTASLLLLGQRLVVLRSRWSREVELRRKRKQGLPRDGEFVSVAVTDIEGYSSVMKAHPRLAARALAMHNAVLRKAAHDHAGLLVEQEGDSWAVAFHEAQDAVAFCMQAQQALHKVDWPMAPTGGRDSGEGPPSESCDAWSSRSGKLRQLLGVGSLGMASLRSGQGGEAWTGPPLAPHALHVVQMASPLFTSMAHSQALSQQDHEGAGKEEYSGFHAQQHSGTYARHHSFTNGRLHSSGANAQYLSIQDDESNANSRSGSLREASKTSGQAPASLHGTPPAGSWTGNGSGSQGGGGRTGSGGRQAGAHRKFFGSLMRPGSADPKDVLSGLRVRMGVACGVMPVGVDICSSGVFELAKVVSDMGNGGQVLIDSATFDLVKDNHMLAAVDHYGYNDKLLVRYSGLATLSQSWRFLPCFRPCGDQWSGSLGDAPRLVVLDMGEFKVPGIDVAAPSRGQRQPEGAPGGPAGAPGAREAPVPGPPGAGAAAAQSKRRGLAPQRSAASASGGAGRVHHQDRLRVFSVLPPCLAGRARAWGGSLRLREGWRQTDRGFFDAPGAAAAQVGPQDAAAAASLCDSLLPDVTMVFAAVEGAKQLVRWRRAGDARRAAHLLRLVLRACLDAVPGGYMCRRQDGDLRYMLAFPTASAALRWCLLVQEALMYAPWPPALLEMTEFSEQRAPADGALLFRGPRLKMGVCEGKPRVLEADHLGRADYFGTNVNQAARYTDVAARGGQVACEVQLAEAVFSDWRLHDDTHGPAIDALHSVLSAPLPPVMAVPAAPAGGAAPSPAAAAGAQPQQALPQGGLPPQDGASQITPPAPPPRALLPPRRPPEAFQWLRWRAALPESEGVEQPGASAMGQEHPAAARQLPLQSRQDVFDVELGTPTGIQGLLRTLSGTHVSRRLLAPRQGPALQGRSLSARAAAGPLQQGRVPWSYGGAVAGRWLGPDVSGRAGIGTACIPGIHEEDALPRHNAAVRALHLGTFVFKGTDALDMVCVTTAALAPRQELLPQHGDPKSKGYVVEERRGVADRAVVSLPEVLPGPLRRAFTQEPPEDGGAGGADADWSEHGGPAAGYASWLSRELARRKLCAAGDGPPASLAGPGSRRAQSFTTQQQQHQFPFGA